MCKQFFVSRAAYHKWLYREMQIQEQENIERVRAFINY